MERLKNGGKQEDQNNIGEDEVDPLDAFMAENDQEYLKDMSVAVVKTKAERTKQAKEADILHSTLPKNDLVDNVPTFLEEEEPAADFMNEMGKRAVQNQMSK